MAKASFEDSMKKLEEVVGKLEGEEVSLEESLKLFEQGVKLMRFCHLRLSEVEEKVQTLVADEKEGARLEEFSG
ncbi:MAG: exodeoxyribonuclease VII small subunit [Pseudomonadota bacterium]|nr:exodeoxyribonuclease VII small subunit [Pseudomonadota bacterium]